MTLSRCHKLLVLSVLVCAIPVSDIYSGPLITKVWAMANSCFSSATALPHYSFGEFPDNKINSNFQSFFSNSSNHSPKTNNSLSSDSSWFSASTVLIGTAVVGVITATGYGLYKWYSGHKKRKAEQERLAQVEQERLAQVEQERLAQVEQERLAQAEQEGLAQAEQERLAQVEQERLAQVEQERLAQVERNTNIKRTLRARLIAEQKQDLIPRKKIKKEQSRFQKEKRLALRKSKLRLASIDSVFRDMEGAAQADSEDEDFVHCDAEITLSDLVKDSSLCNNLTVNYLNELYKDQGKEHKEHVIGFLRAVKQLGAVKSGWNNKDIMPLIKNGGTSFVIDRLEYIAKGEQLVTQIVSEEVSCNTPQSQKEYLDSLISITWYFYAKALQKGDGFSKSASFNIQSKPLMDFFMGYYHQVRKWHPEFCEAGKAWVASYAKFGANKLGDHPFAYERCSSHLKSLDKINYGIDIRYLSNRQEKKEQEKNWFNSLSSLFDGPQKQNDNFEALEELQQMNKALPDMEKQLKHDDILKDQIACVSSLHQLLPDDKAHLLFIPYDTNNGRFVLKPESHGTTVFDLPDAIAHGLEFLHGSKDNDYDYTRREKVKKDVNFKKLQKSYKSIVPGQGDTIDLITGEMHTSGVDDTKEIAVYGVQHMLSRLSHWIDKSQEPRCSRLKKIKNQLIGLYTDNHDIRFAHEVVFKEIDFRYN